MEEWRDPTSEESESGWDDRGKMGNEKEVETSRLTLRWVRNLKSRPACPFGFNQADGRLSQFSVLGRGWIYYQWAIICVTAAY